jgi:hypothetical protein
MKILKVKIELVLKGAPCLLCGYTGEYLVIITAGDLQMQELEEFLQYELPKKRFVVYDNQVIFNMCKKHLSRFAYTFDPTLMPDKFEREFEMEYFKKAIKAIIEATVKAAMKTSEMTPV